MSDPPASKRSFTWADQELFARLSSDRNPMHMDPLFARRTQPGAAVVHGIHVLLWALDCWAASGASLERLAEVRVRFSKFVYVDKPIELRVLANEPSQTKLGIFGDGLNLFSITLLHGERASATALPGVSPSAPSVVATPAQLSLEEMRDLSGWLTPPCSNDDTAANFPALANAIGTARVAAMMQLSTLVGMHCPGLYSMFLGVQLSFVEGDDSSAGFRWRTHRVDERYRLVMLRIAGSGLRGEVSTFARRAPRAAVRVAELAHRVQPTEFAGVRALVIGGSRGLGAACAKLLAAGGAEVVISYVHGRADALEIRDDIVAARGAGACEVIPFDVSKDAAEQLGAGAGFDQIYYFATSQIFRQKPDGYSPALFAEFVRVYVDGFHAAVRAVRQQALQRRLAIFYPSSVAVDEQSQGMTEYVMAKLAGEALCQAMTRDDPNLRCVVHRIPRTSTDQTATVAPIAEADPVDVMLPLVRRMQPSPASATNSQ